MTKVIIDPGICGFITNVAADSADGETVAIQVGSGCGGVMKMASELAGELDPFEVCLKKGGNGPVYDSARTCCPHAACPVPAGIIKCVEVECNLALPKEASIRFEK